MRVPLMVLIALLSCTLTSRECVRFIQTGAQYSVRSGINHGALVPQDYTASCFTKLILGLTFDVLLSEGCV